MDYPHECRLPLARPTGGGKAGEISGRNSMMPPTFSMTTPQMLTITNVDEIYFQANRDRRYLEIQNQSGADWVISFDSRAIQGFGLIIPSGSSRIFDSYTITKAEVHLIALRATVNPLLGIGIEGFTS